MAVNITFTVNGSVVNEVNPLDFSTVQAGTSSAIKTVSVTNTGTSDALMCAIEAVEASTNSGFSTTTQAGTAAETYSAQQFALDANSQFYNYAVVGTGKNYTNKTGGTLVANTGTDTYVTKWVPPSTGNSGAKEWGCRLSCVYI
jgi:hypothetical protein